MAQCTVCVAGVRCDVAGVRCKCGWCTLQMLPVGAGSNPEALSPQACPQGTPVETLLRV